MTEKQDMDLTEWCLGELKSARDQMELFGAKGVKAMLQMPDGTTQDITEAVVRHQTKNLDAFERLLSFLRVSPPVP